MDKENKIVILIVGGFIVMILSAIWIYTLGDISKINWSKDGYKLVLSIVFWIGGLVMLLVGLTMAGMDLRPPWMWEKEK